MLSILLYDSLHYFLQAVSLAEPGARLPDSKSPALTALGSLVLEGPCVAFYKDSSDSNSGPQVCEKRKKILLPTELSPCLYIQYV